MQEEGYPPLTGKVELGKGLSERGISSCQQVNGLVTHMIAVA